MSLGWHPRPAGRIRRPAESSGARTQTRDRFTHDSARPSFRRDAGNYPRDAGATLSFLESVPEVAAKLKEAHTKERKFEDVVRAVEQATVLVLVY